MRLLPYLILAVLIGPAQAADNTVILTPGSGVTMRTKDVGSGVESPLQIPGDTAGNALATAPGTPNGSFALPIQGVTSGTAVPVSAGSLPLPTGAATSALQTTGNSTLTTINTTLGSPYQAGGALPLPSGAATSALQGTNTATTAHTCSTAGYSEIGCLGQIDDDVKGAVPLLSATAWNTNTYTTGTTNPGNADLHGAPWIDIGAINGVAALAGAGATGTGSPRVTAAQDTTTIAGSSPGTAGTPSANVVSVQGEASMTPVAVSGAVNVTQTDCSIALTTGGAAQNIITAAATIHGFRIMNIDASAGSGEPVWISFTGTAVAAAIASYPLAAPTASTFAGAGSYSSEFGSGINTNVSVIAATTGHKISCTKW